MQKLQHFYNYSSAIFSQVKHFIIVGLQIFLTASVGKRSTATTGYDQTMNVLSAVK